MKLLRYSVLVFFFSFAILVIKGVAHDKEQLGAPAGPFNSSGYTPQLLLRGDGSVIVDGWKQLSVSSQIGQPVESQYPTSIILGSSLNDSTPICFEVKGQGSSCVVLGELRKVKK